MICFEHINDAKKSFMELVSTQERVLAIAEAACKLPDDFRENSKIDENLEFSASLKIHFLPNTQPRGIDSKQFLYRWIAFDLRKVLVNSQPIL